MTKEELVKNAEGLYQEVLEANAYYSLIMQYKENQMKHYEEMVISSAFYSISFSAWQRALFMELAKMYDKSNNVISIGRLLGLCSENIDLFPQYRCVLENEHGGEKHKNKVLYEHQLRKDEECFFKEKVESQRNIYKVLGMENPDEIPVTIQLDFTGYVELYQKELHSLHRKIENITIHRNKIYAHNDGVLEFDFDKIYEKNPINYHDIKMLIDFGFDVTRLVIGVLKGVNKAQQYSNIDDWKGTLQLVKLGNKYRDIEIASHIVNDLSNV